MNSYKFIVKGRVQGVYYRKNVSENAQKVSFKGYVKNLNDGDVEACVSCEDERLEEFKDILKQGSPNSIVKEIHQYKCSEIFTKDFEIRY